MLMSLEDIGLVLTTIHFHFTYPVSTLRFVLCCFIVLACVVYPTRGNFSLVLMFRRASSLGK